MACARRGSALHGSRRRVPIDEIRMKSVRVFRVTDMTTTARKGIVQHIYACPLARTYVSHHTLAREDAGTGTH